MFGSMSSLIRVCCEAEEEEKGEEVSGQQTWLNPFQATYRFSMVVFHECNTERLLTALQKKSIDIL